MFNLEGFMAHRLQAPETMHLVARKKLSRECGNGLEYRSSQNRSGFSKGLYRS